ncbi:MAG: lytic transglycosylase domain-containing protein [Candidatus Peribacteraceae bacterium]|nr:lytic transglycosylase domain-containing protein [Candidatus Peribacteraceae bacterium]
MKQIGTPKQLLMLIFVLTILVSIVAVRVQNSDIELDTINIPSEAIAKETPREFHTQKSDNIKRKHQFELTNEMLVLSEFIQSRNYRMPSIVTDIIAYNIFSISQKEKVPVALVVGIMGVESNYDPTAISKVKAKGLMQVLNSRCRDLVIDKQRIFELDYNIESGICIFKEHLSIKGGNVDKALFGYVGGDKVYPSKIYKVMADYTIFISSISKESSLHASNFKK